MALITSNVQLTPTDTAPAGGNATEGSIYWDNSESRMKGYTGGAFRDTNTYTAVPDGLVAWYKDGGAQDFAGGFHGTLTDGLPEPDEYAGPWVGTKRATLYGETTGYVVLPTTNGGQSNFPDGAKARTLTMWVKPNGTLDSSDYLFGFGGGATSLAFNARGTSNKLSFMGHGNDHDGYGSYTYSTGTWVRIFYTYDGTNVATWTTTNGTVTQNWTSARALNTGTSTASIGAHANSPSTHNDTHCTIRDFRIYSRLLSVAEMQLMWLE